jgi:hypothetical protein
MDKLKSDGQGNWWRDEGPTIDEQINKFCEEMGVQLVFTSPPSITVLGKDEAGIMHLRTAVSILYVWEKEEEETDGTRGSPGVSRKPEDDRTVVPGEKSRDERPRSLADLAREYAEDAKSGIKRGPYRSAEVFRKHFSAGTGAGTGTS